jgi:hypothetical protein
MPEARKPKAPPLEHQRKLIDWLLRYGEDFALYREIYSSNVERFIELFTESVEKELNANPTHAALRQRCDKCFDFYLEAASTLRSSPLLFEHSLSAICGLYDLEWRAT